MTLKETRKYHEQIVLVMGFLGSVTFAALVLVIQAKQTFDVSADFAFWYLPSPEYFEVLVMLLASTGFLMIIGSFASARVVALEEDLKWLRRFAETCIFLSLLSLLIVLPMLILPVIPYPQNQFVGLLFAIEGLLLFFLGRFTSSKKPSANNLAP